MGRHPGLVLGLLFRPALVHVGVRASPAGRGPDRRGHPGGVLLHAGPQAPARDLVGHAHGPVHRAHDDHDHARLQPGTVVGQVELGLQGLRDDVRDPVPLPGGDAAAEPLHGARDLSRAVGPQERALRGADRRRVSRLRTRVQLLRRQQRVRPRGLHGAAAHVLPGP